MFKTDERDDHEARRFDGGQDRHRHGGHPGLEGQTATIDQLNVTTYLHSDNAAAGSFSEQFILNVASFGLDGAPVDVPGFGTQFGLYFLIDATGQAGATGLSFDTMTIKLMVDAGNDDGVPSSTLDDGLGFSNGTAGDYALATGTLVSATFTADPDGTRHPNFIQALAPTVEGKEVFGPSLDMGALLKEVLTSPGGAQVFPADNGGTTQIIDGTGFGNVALSPQTPLSLNLAELGHTDRGHAHDIMTGCFR